MPQKTSNCFQNKRNYYYFFFFSGFRFFEIYNATVAALETPKKFPKSSQILETFLSGDSSGHVTSRHVTYLASVRQLLHEASLDLHVSLQFGQLRLHQEHCVQQFRHDADEIQDDEKLNRIATSWDKVASDLLELALPDVHDDPEALPAVQGVFGGVHLGRRGESQEVCKRIRRQGQKVES